MKKEDTRERIIKRKYEQTHKEERKKASEQFNTRIPRESYEKICSFLKEHGVSKVELIFAGYEALQNQYAPKDKQNKEK